MFKLNPILNRDSYKFGHIDMMPEGVTEVYSNLTPRSMRRFHVPDQFKDGRMLWIGGQYVISKIHDYFTEHFFSIENFDFESISETVTPFNCFAHYDVQHLRDLHKLGYLPIEVKTLPEGELVPEGVPVLTIRNTHPDFAWLTNALETWISNESWHIATSATTAYHFRRIGQYWYKKTGGNMDFLDYAFHDFSLRGHTSMESGAASGAGYLSVFRGSDTVPAIPFIQYYYGCSELIACSVPASEHMIQTSYEEDDREYIRRLISEVVPTGIVSVVADGYDYWNVITNIIPSLKDDILSREVNELGMAKVVIRPDSGDPVRIICGYNEDEIERHADGNVYPIIPGLDEFDYTRPLSEAEIRGSVDCLWNIFSGIFNEEGYKVLNPRIGLIYGDSITMDRANEIFRRLEMKCYSADNIVLGVGSYSLQGVTRDTLGFAIKATNIVRNGVDIPLFKNPKTDDGTKKSAKGLLKVVTDNGNYKLIDNVSRAEEKEGYLTLRYKDGLFEPHVTFDTIRSRVSNQLSKELM